MQVADADAVPGGLIANLGGDASSATPANAAPGHPDAETHLAVVAPGSVICSLPVNRHAGEFPAPEDERPVKQAALLEIGW